jgi:hypothetical protein
LSLVHRPPELVSHLAVPASSHTFQVSPAWSSWWNRLAMFWWQPMPPSCCSHRVN